MTLTPTTCSICSAKAYGRGFCSKHYQRWWKTGSALTPPKPHTTHNLRHGHKAGRRISKTYSTWANMLTRCRNPKATHYRYYGGRGVTVCERWLVFANFLEDMGERPEGLTLDRRDPYGNYEPDNCRWATWTEQRANRRVLV